MRIELTIDISRRWLMLFGGALLGVGSLALVGLAQAHGGSTDLVHTCYQVERGTLRWVEPTQVCGNSEKPLDWSKGQVLRSPNGRFTLSMTDTGIILQGPSSSVKITETSVDVASGTVKLASNGTTSISSGGDLKAAAGGVAELKSASNTTIEATSALSLTSGSTTTMTAGSGYTVNAGTTAGINAGNAVNVNTKDIKLSATGGAELNAGSVAAVNGATGLNLNGKAVKVNGADSIEVKSGDAILTERKDGTVILKGKDIDVVGSGQVNIQASGDVTIHGSSVTQN